MNYIVFDLEWNQCPGGKEKENKKLLLLSVDLDGLKFINDSFGHNEGDFAIYTVAYVLEDTVSDMGVCARFGGDEFMVFLCNMKEDAIIKKEAKRLEKFFQSFQAGSYVKYSATASIGAAVYPKDAQTFEGLYRAADQAMYVAKKKGKNRLAFYGEESTEP